MKKYFLPIAFFLISLPALAATFVINDFTVNSGADLICGWDDSATNGECFAIGNGLETSGLTLSSKYQMSITADGSGLKLSGDAATPGNSKYYGTDGTGVKGWYATAPPSAPGGLDTQLQYNNAGAFAGAMIEYSFDGSNTITLHAETGNALYISSNTGVSTSTISGLNSSLFVVQPIGISLFSSGSIVATAGTDLALTGDTFTASSTDFTYDFQSGFGQFAGLDFSNGTTDRSYVFQDGDGTLAFLTDIPAVDPAISSIGGVSWVQGDLLYWSGVDTAARLAKDTNATRYLSNTGGSNNPAWDQINLTNGVTGDLPYNSLAQGSARSVLGVSGNATADVASIQGTANQVLRVNGAGNALAFGQIDLSSSGAVINTVQVANGGCAGTTESECVVNLGTPLDDAVGSGVDPVSDRTRYIVWNALDDTGYQVQGNDLSDAITAPLSGLYQPLDADLTALAANSTNGFWARTGAGVGSARTLTAPTAGLTISNPAGTAGNPTFALANDLAALEGLSGTGYPVRTGTDTWALRSFTQGIGIIITNPAGTAGATDIKVDLAATKMEWTGDHTFTDGNLRIFETGGGSEYFSFKSATLSGNKNIQLPALTADDTLVFLAQTQTLTNKTLTSPVLNTAVSGTAFLNENDLVSNSATKIPSQASVKAYVDARADHKAPVAGRYYPPEEVGQFVGTTPVAADWTYCAPFRRDVPFTLDKLSLNVTTMGVGSARLGIYTDVDGVPTTRTLNAGTVSTATTGVKEITGLAQAMPAGKFWVCFQTEVAIGVATFNGTVVGNDYNASVGVPAFGNTIVLSLDFTSTWAGSLPATLTVTQVNGVDTPQLYWRP